MVILEETADLNEKLAEVLESLDYAGTSIIEGGITLCECKEDFSDNFDRVYFYRVRLGNGIEFWIADEEYLHIEIKDPAKITLSEDENGGICIKESNIDLYKIKQLIAIELRSNHERIMEAVNPKD